MTELRRVLLQDRADRVSLGIALECALPRQNLVQESAERKDVAARVGVLATHLLRRHVAHGAHQHSRAGQSRARFFRRATPQLRQSEIENFDSPVFCDEYIFGLQVAVAALSHPNILGIYDLCSADGVTFAAMELLYEDVVSKVELTLVGAGENTVAKSAIGSRSLRPARLAALVLGDTRLRNLQVYVTPRVEAGRPEDGMLPMLLFDAIYVNNANAFLILNPHRAH